MAVPPDPPREEQGSKSNLAKPRRADALLLILGVVVVGALLGRLLLQQWTSNRAAETATVERPQRESAPPAAPEARPSATTPRNGTSTVKPNAPPIRVEYRVTHKHRLRDCHGTLTFTRVGVQFESDDSDDSFVFLRDDVTIEGEVLRVGDTRWRFEFSDDVRVERLFNDWKTGTLPLATAP